MVEPFTKKRGELIASLEYRVAALAALVILTFVPTGITVIN
jgi:hypothetical protein